MHGEKSIAYNSSLVSYVLSALWKASALMCFILSFSFILKALIISSNDFQYESLQEKNLCQVLSGITSHINSPLHTASMVCLFVCVVTWWNCLVFNNCVGKSVIRKASSYSFYCDLLRHACGSTGATVIKKKNTPQLYRRNVWVRIVLVIYSFMVQAGHRMHFSTPRNLEPRSTALALLVSIYHVFRPSFGSLKFTGNCDRLPATRLLCRELPVSKLPLSQCCSLSLWEVWCYVASGSRTSWMFSNTVPLRLC